MDKLCFYTRKFIQEAGDFLFLSGDRWLTDTRCAVALQPGMEVDADRLEDSLFFRGKGLDDLGKYLRDEVRDLSPLTAWSKPIAFYYPDGPNWLCRKCRSEDSREIACNYLYLRVIKDIWPAGQLYLAKYWLGRPELAALVAMTAQERLVGVVMARTLRNESPEFVRYWNSMPVFPIERTNGKIGRLSAAA